MTRLQPPSITILLPRRERYAQNGAGAVSTVVDDLARHSRQRAALSVLGSPVEEPLDGAAFRPVKLAPFWRGGTTRRYLLGAVKMEKNTATVVEVHNRPKYIAFLRRLLPHAALALYLHNDPRSMEGAKTALERRRLAGQVQAVVCVSEYIRRCFLEGNDESAVKTFVVRNAVDTGALHPFPEQEKQKEIVFVGRTISDKGPHLLVEAGERLLPAFPEWKIVLIGGRFFGEGKAEVYEQELFRRVANFGAQGEVTGYLPRREVIARLQRASVAVLPSLWEEPIQLAAMEAAACGCAVITTRRGGIPEGMGEAALYLGNETSEDVVELLRPLMEEPALLQKWQQKARAHVVQNSNISQAVADLDGLREKIIEFGP